MTCCPESKDALQRFRRTLSDAPRNMGLVVLERAGWEEQFPQPGHWAFTHAECPGITIHAVPKAIGWHSWIGSCRPCQEDPQC